MHRKKTLSTLILLSIFSFLNPSGVLAVSKSYIEAVKLDINEFETKTWKQQPDSEWLPSSQKFSAGRSDTLASFSSFLKKRFPSSHLFYKKLDAKDQHQVWRNYSNTGNLGGIRSDIFSLRKKARRSN